MTTQAQLFGAANLAATVQIPEPPAVVPHSWPFPGITPEDSARAAIANSPEYADMLAAVIKSQGAAKLTAGQVFNLIPQDWRQVCGRYTHASLDVRRGKERGIEVVYVSHDNGGFHWTYAAAEYEAA